MPDAVLGDDVEDLLRLGLGAGERLRADDPLARGRGDPHGVEVHFVGKGDDDDIDDSKDEDEGEVICFVFVGDIYWICWIFW